MVIMKGFCLSFVVGMVMCSRMVKKEPKAKTISSVLLSPSESPKYSPIFPMARIPRPFDSEGGAFSSNISRQPIGFYSLDVDNSNSSETSSLGNELGFEKKFELADFDEANEALFDELEPEDAEFWKSDIDRAFSLLMEELAITYDSSKTLKEIFAEHEDQEDVTRVVTSNDLEYFAMTGNEMLCHLIHENPKETCGVGQGSPYMEIAIKSGHTNLVKSLCDELAVEPNYQDNICLRLACHCGDVGMVSALLSTELCDPTACLYAPVRIAARQSKFDIVSKLLKMMPRDLEALRVAIYEFAKNSANNEKLTQFIHDRNLKNTDLYLPILKAHPNMAGIRGVVATIYHVYRPEIAREKTRKFDNKIRRGGDYEENVRKRWSCKRALGVERVVKD